MNKSSWKEAGPIGILAFADPLSEILRALDVSYVREAHARVVAALADVGVRTKTLHLGWLHPGYSSPGSPGGRVGSPFDFTGWATPDLYRHREDEQQELWTRIASALPPDSPRLVGQSASGRARIADVAPSDPQAVLEAILVSALDEPTDWTVAALRDAAVGVDPREPWWRAAQAREANDAASLEAALDDAKRLYSAVGATLVLTTFRVKWKDGLLQG